MPSIYKFTIKRFITCVPCLIIGYLAGMIMSLVTLGFCYVLVGDVIDSILVTSSILGSFFGGVACVTISSVESRKMMVLYYTLFDALIYIGGVTWDLLQGHHEEMFFASWWLEYLFAFVSVSATYFGCVTTFRILLKKQKKEVRHG